MEIKKYRAFWEAFIISVFVFGLGFLFGYIIENNRSQQISFEILESENNLLDARNILYSIDNQNLNCDTLKEKNIEFGNIIYEDAKKISNYEKANQLSKEIIEEQHRKYDLLRTIFWQNSIELKKKCPNSFQTVVYLYDYNLADINEKSKQQVFSNFLTELKYQMSDEIILIPIAKNLQIISLDLMINKYNLNTTSIIINEELVFTDPKEFDQIRKILKESNQIINLN